MSDLIQSVQNGTVNQTGSTSTSSSSTLGTNSLGKDAFLQLLVTQMKYQDPLNPNTDTQFVAQLATFSQLEQMQNLSQTTTNSQAFGLVGMNVTVKSVDTSGNTSYKSGTVDYVVMSGGKAKLSIEGSLYSLDQLEEVIDNTYLIKQGLPYMANEVKENFDKSNPEDIKFNVNLGSGETIATDVAILLDGELVDSEYVTLNGTEVTISKEALQELEVGKHSATLVFNDALYTTVSGKIQITVENSNSSEDDSTDIVDNTIEESNTIEEDGTGAEGSPETV